MNKTYPKGAKLVVDPPGAHQVTMGRAGSSAEVAELFWDRVLSEDCERIWVAALDSRNNVRYLAEVARGGGNHCAVTIPQILRPVLVAGCTRMVLVHNHPSGDPGPSDEDTVLTTKVQAACKTVGLVLVDHLILGKRGQVFFMARGSYPSEIAFLRETGEIPVERWTDDMDTLGDMEFQGWVSRLRESTYVVWFGITAAGKSVLDKPANSR